MLFAIGLILPFFIGQIPAVGKMLLPMHIPVLYPNAIAMAFEMGTYGLVARWLYSHAKWQRTKERYEEPGGNVDYKRFEQEVLVPLKKGETVFYRPYYPPKWSFLETAEIAPCRVNIVEGTYSCHERLEAYYDLKVFLTGVKRRWNFRRNGFRSRSCILKNAAPEAGATSVLQCVMRCRKNPIQNLF